MLKKELNAFLIKFRIALSHSGIKISSNVAVAFMGENRQENNTSDGEYFCIIDVKSP